MKPFRILQIITQLTTGGAELQLLNLCSRLPRERFQCHVVSLVDGGDLIPRFEAEGIPVLALDRRDRGGRSGQMRALMTEIRRWRPDLVHTWLQKANHVGRIAASLSSRCPLVACFRDLGFMASWGDTLLDGLFDPRTALTLHNSAAGRRAFLERVRGANASRQQLLSNGLDPGRFRPDPETRIRIRAERGLAEDEALLIMVARLAPIKDPQLFLGAARRLSREFPRARFWLVGEGPLLEPMTEELKRQPCPGFWLAGRREDVPALMAAADIAVLTSRSEGLSNTILEAMSCELPVVATAVGGNEELVEEGISGYLQAERSPGALAASLRPLLASGQRRREMGAAGRRRVQADFSLDGMAERAAAFYTGLLPARP